MQSPKIRKLVTLFSRLPGVGEKTAQRYVLSLLTNDAAIAKELGAELATLHEHVRPCERCGNLADVERRSTPLGVVGAKPQDLADVERRSTPLGVVGAKPQDLADVERRSTPLGVVGAKPQDLADVDPDEPNVLCAVCRDTRRDGQLLCVVGRVHDLMAIERTGSMRGRYFVLGRLLSPLEGIGPEDLPIPRLMRLIKDENVTEVIVATPPSVDGEATALLLKRELAPANVKMTRIASGVPHGGDLEYADPITMGRALAGRQAL